MSKTLKIILIGLGVVIIGVAVYFLTAGGNNRLLKFIPNNAAFVVKADIKALYDLGKQNNLFELKMMQKGMKESSKEGGLGKLIAAVIEKPEDCGIDFRKPAYIFGEMMSRGKATALIMELRSESKFADFIAKKRDSDTKIERTSEFTHLEMGTGEYLSWGNGILVYSMNKTESTGYPSNLLKRSRPGMEGNLNMKEMLSTDGIITFLIRPGETLKWNEDNVDLPIKDIWNPELMSRTMTYIGKLDFVKGGISLMAKAFSNDGKKSETPELLKKGNNALRLAKYAKREVQPAALMACNFNVDGLVKFIADNMGSETKDEFLENDVVKMLKSDLNGEFLLCLPSHNEEDGELAKDLGLQIVAGTNDRNTGLESKLQDIGTEKSGGSYLIPMGFASLPLSFGEKHMILGEAGVSKIRTSGIDQGYLNSPMFMMIDFEKCLSSLPGVNDNEVKSLRKSGLVWLMGYTNESVNSDLKFRDKEKNGLASLLELIDKSIQEIDEQREERNNKVESIDTPTQVEEDEEY